LIQKRGHVSDEEMYLVYNMGEGFVVVVSESDSDAAIQLAKHVGYEAFSLGYVTAEAGKRVHIRPKGLVGEQGRFSHESDR
jgi:phosphoribosylformylglycinamidine cyclo-ligase